MDITEFARKGGLARSNKLTPKQRKRIAKKAAKQRWKDHEKASPTRVITGIG